MSSIIDFSLIFSLLDRQSLSLIFAMADADFPFYRPGRTEYDDTMSRASTVVKRRRKVDEEKFALGRRGILVFFTLSVLTLMAALDGTSLSVALPVSV